MPGSYGKPVIGITTHLIEQVRQTGHTQTSISLSAQYAKAVVAAGGIPILIPTGSIIAPHPADVLGCIDGLILSGGRQLPGSFFEKNREFTLRQTDPERWDYETEMARLAFDRKIPVLGICRGMQTLAEALVEGRVSIIRDNGLVGETHYQKGRPDETSHLIETSADSKLREFLGPAIRVNSFHRQIVSRTPTGFSATAYSNDGYIEALEADDGCAMGVQFHPEWLYPNHAGFLSIFSEMIKQAHPE